LTYYLNVNRDQLLPPWAMTVQLAYLCGIVAKLSHLITRPDTQALNALSHSLTFGGWENALSTLKLCEPSPL
jgi:hypothetical protein